MRPSDKVSNIVIVDADTGEILYFKPKRYLCSLTFSNELQKVFDSFIRGIQDNRHLYIRIECQDTDNTCVFGSVMS